MCPLCKPIVACYPLISCQINKDVSPRINEGLSVTKLLSAKLWLRLAFVLCTIP